MTVHITHIGHTLGLDFSAVQATLLLNNNILVGKHFINSKVERLDKNIFHKSFFFKSDVLNNFMLY